MKIIFRHHTKGAYEMLQIAKQWFLVEKDAIADAEDTMEFTYEGVDFYLRYDRNSEENKDIMPFEVVSKQDDMGESDANAHNATKKLCGIFKDNLDECELEE
jgi:hypothetical protein